MGLPSAISPVVGIARQQTDASAVAPDHQSRLISWTQSGPDGGWSAAEGRQGSMKPLRGGEGGTRKILKKVGADTGVSNQPTQTAEPRSRYLC